MEDYVNPDKTIDSDGYWIPAKRPKVMAALRRAFPPAEWDVLTTTIDAQIAVDDKQHPPRWLAQLTQHYLGDEPIIQSTHNFLRILKQEPGMSIQNWHTLVRSEYQKCNFPIAVDDRLKKIYSLLASMILLNSSEVMSLLEKTYPHCHLPK